MKFRASIILLWLCSALFCYSQNQPPVVTVVGDQVYCPQSQQKIVTAFDITDVDDTQTEAFYIQISSGYVFGQDQLLLTGVHPNIQTSWNATEAKMTIRDIGGGLTNYSDIRAAVLDVVFVSSNNSPSDKGFSLTVGSANYLASTDHYYEYVQSLDINWNTAKTAAEASTYYGLQGYLATLLSAEEAQIAGELISGNGWIGASDRDNEGVWEWVTGPENGTRFWSGDENGSNVAGQYSNWNIGEPNNVGNEDYAHITSNSIGLAGSWNDLADVGGDGAYRAMGYIVEYGGMPSDPTLNISGSSVLRAPSILNIDIPSSCEGDPITLTVNSNTDDILWYSNATASTPIHNGFIYNTNLSSSTSFWLLPSSNGCTNGTRTKIDVVVNLKPNITTPTPLEACDYDFDGDADFKLDTKINEIISGQPDIEVSFHLSPGDAQSGTNDIPYDYLDATNQILNVRLENTLSGCFAATTLELIVNTPEISTFAAVAPICEGDILNPLPTRSNEGVLGSWSPALDNTVTTKYTFTPDANECATEAFLTIVVIPTVTPIFDQVLPICVGESLAPLPLRSINGINGTWSPALNNRITTTYVFTPSGGTCVLPTTMTISVLQETEPLFDQVPDVCIGDPFNLPLKSKEGITGQWSPTINSLNTTTYTFTPNPGQCAKETTMTVVIKQISDLNFTASVTSEDFVNNQTIEVTANGGSGIYDYQIDGRPWQEEAVFQNVIGCNDHLIKVRDALGCSTQPEQTITILYYQKFFTPNGDGVNDSWNIPCLKDYPQATIKIFNRFGKLLLVIRPDYSGWDGTHNNLDLPTNDYWFVVDYINFSGERKQYRSHFTLRR